MDGQIPLRIPMKKSEYWQLIRTERGHKGHKQYERQPGVIVVNDVGLASYAYDFWKQNGVLPNDYLPIPEKGEEGGDVLRRMWEFAERDPSFQNTALDAFEKYFITQGKEKDEWRWMCRTDVAPIHSTIEAPQLRRLIQKAILLSGGITTDDKNLFCRGLMFLCVEHCRLKFRAAKYGNCAQALFNNADVLSLIAADTSSMSKVETVLEKFEGLRKELGTRCDSLVDKDLEYFNKDIRPILLGKLVKEAETFNNWQSVFDLSYDRDTKIFALYHMSDKAKGIGSMVAMFESAQSVGLEAIVNSFKEKWKEICREREAKDLMYFPPNLNLDAKFIEDLILQKCED